MLPRPRLLLQLLQLLLLLRQPLGSGSAAAASSIRDDDESRGGGGSGALTLRQYNNTAMAGVASSSSRLDTLSFSLPGAAPFSAEVSGTLSPELAAGSHDVAWWSFACTFEHVDYAFVRIDGHMVCQYGAYNSTAPLDPGPFRLRSKRAELVVAADVYHTRPSAKPVRVALQWCAEGDRSRCEQLPSAALAPTLPEPEQKRRELQRGMAQGWGSWLHRDVLSVLLLPDAATLTVMLCRISTQECLRESNIDGNGGGVDPTHPVRVGSHAIDHSYSQMYVWGPPLSRNKVNVSIEYTVGGAKGEELDLLISPVVQPDGDAAALDDFAVAVAGSFAWGRVGTVSSQPGHRQLQLQGHGLPGVEVTATAAALSQPLRGAIPPGLLHGEPCQLGTKACGAQSCAQNAPAGIVCASGVCLTPPGAPGAEGKCTQPKRLPHLVLPLHTGPVGVTTRHGAANATLSSIQARVAAAAARQRTHEARFGQEHADLAQALGAAVSWRNIAVPAESGPLMPTTYGFSWIDQGPSTNDWRYIQFCWDNIFASYTAGVLGYRDAAYSNLISIIKAKANDGFVPNHAAGGAVSGGAEPAVGGKVLLELYRRFNDTWIVELLLDDLIDWNDWQWERCAFLCLSLIQLNSCSAVTKSPLARSIFCAVSIRIYFAGTRAMGVLMHTIYCCRRRVVGPSGGSCEEPGFLTIGNDYVNCSTNVSTASNCPGGGESVRLVLSIARSSLLCLQMRCPVWSGPVRSCPVLSGPVRSCPALPCPALPCPALPCPAIASITTGSCLLSECCGGSCFLFRASINRRFGIALWQSPMGLEATARFTPIGIQNRRHMCCSSPTYSRPRSSSSMQSPSQRWLS
jgi:hypothetical protein